MYEELKVVLDQIISDKNFDPANIVVRIKEILQSKYPEIYQEWEKAGFEINHLFPYDKNDKLKGCTTLLSIAAESGDVKVLTALRRCLEKK